MTKMPMGANIIDTNNPFGWVPPFQRTNAQHEAHEAAMALAQPRFYLDGTYRDVTGRFALWMAVQQVLAGKVQDPQLLPYIWQLSGSCVGASGWNCGYTLMSCEIVAGELEEWKTIWWPFTYARSRFRAGMLNPGEGSFASSWAAGFTRDGSLAIDQAPNLPPFQSKEGWIQLASASQEISWSDGDAQNVMALMSVANFHLCRNFAPIRSAAEAKGSISTARPMIMASMFGTRGPTLKGNPQIAIAEWDDEWPHQMYLDEAWDHPTEGLVFRVGNNWGPRAHRPPTQGEPWGGFYITARTLDRICASRDSELFSFDGLNGWKVRELDIFV